MTTLSVLMCVYEKDDDKNFIEAIDSLIENKKFIDTTVIVINGYISNIKLNKINNSAKDLTIQQIKLKKNIGFSRALNIGLKYIKTDWVVRFDSDDICIPNRFLFIKNKIKELGKDYDVIGTYIEEFNEKNNLKMIRKVPLSFEKIKRNLVFYNPMNHVSVFFKASLINISKDDLFYPLIDGFEDYALWIKLIKANKMLINVPIVTVLVRTGDGMLKRRGGLKYILGEIKFRVFAMKNLPINYLPLNFLICIFRIFAFSSPIYLKKIIYKLIRS